MYTTADGLSTPPGGLGHSEPVGFSAVGEDWPQSPLSIASRALPSVASVGIIRQIIGFNPTQSVSIRLFRPFWIACGKKQASIEPRSGDLLSVHRDKKK